MRQRTFDRTARVALVDLDELEPLAPGPHPESLLVVRAAGAVVGQVLVPDGPLEPEAQRAAVGAELELYADEARLRARIDAALGRDGADPGPPPTVSVVVCTRDRPDDLARCLDALVRLRTRPQEVIVVDNAGSDPRTHDVCRARGVRLLLEPTPGQTRARNRGIAAAEGALVAFTDDDCIVDEGWLDDLGRAFADPLTAAVCGGMSPWELDAPAQYLFEAHGGFQRHPRPLRLEALTTSPSRAASVAGAGGNMILRREAIVAVGGFAEDLGPGTPARSSDDKEAFQRLLRAGHRLRFDPDRLVWHRHRSTLAALRRIMEDYGTAEVAFLLPTAFQKRDPGALFVLRWWVTHLGHDVRRRVSGAPGAVPLDLTAREALGMLRGLPARRESRRSRARIAPVVPQPCPAPTPSVAVTRAQAPGVSVALASYDRRESLKLTLEALARQAPTGSPWDVVLILDGSTDGSAEMARGLGVPYPLTVVEQPNSGLARARNEGARRATHPIVAFLDDDIRPEPWWIAAHARAHRDAPRPQLALGYYPPAITAGDLNALIIRAWWEDHFRRLADPGHRFSFTDICDGNSSLRTEDFWAVGGFDEQFSGRRQDWEYGLRVLAHGLPVQYHADARADHYFDTSAATTLRNARREARDDVQICLAHPSARAGLPFAALNRTWVQALLGEGERAHVKRAIARPAVTTRLLRALEYAGLRGRYARLLALSRLMHYAWGLADALGDVEQVAAFVGPPEGDADLVIDLDAGATGSCPTPAWTRVVVREQGRVLTACRSHHMGGPNGWDELVVELARRGALATRSGEPAEELVGGVGTLGADAR